MQLQSGVASALRNFPGVRACVGMLAVSFAALLGCAATVNTPVLDKRVPSLGPAADGRLLSRSVCGPHATVNVWQEWNQEHDIRVSIFDSYKCRAARGLFAQTWDDFDEGKFVDGESAVFSREPEAPTSVIVIANDMLSECEVHLPPRGPGTIHVIVEVDEVMARTRFDTFTPRQDRLFERFLRRRDRNAKACREELLKPRRRARRRSR
jgi:hypothetical protein